MVVRRKPQKPRPGKPSQRRSLADTEDLSLAEELLRASRKDRTAFVAGWEKFMKQLGIRGKPIGAKKLREMALREGINPESNEFSRGIIAMREE